MSLRCKVFAAPNPMEFTPPQRVRDSGGNWTRPLTLEESINKWLSTPCYPPDAPTTGIHWEQIHHVVMSDSRVLVFYSDAKEGCNLKP